MAKIPVEHIISGVRAEIDEHIVSHPVMGKLFKPVRNAKPKIVYDTVTVREPAESSHAPKRGNKPNKRKTLEGVALESIEGEK